MMSDQPIAKNDKFVVWLTTNKFATFFIRNIASKLDPIIFRATNGRWTTFGPPQMPMLTMTAIGKKSGELRPVQVASVIHDGYFHVVASAMGQAKHPAWKANIEANPKVTVQVTGSRFEAMAEKLTDAEKSAIWSKIKQAIPQISVYEARTDRTICVFRLRKTGEA